MQTKMVVTTHSGPLSAREYSRDEESCVSLTLNTHSTWGINQWPGKGVLSWVPLIAHKFLIQYDRDINWAKRLPKAILWKHKHLKLMNEF